MKYLKIKIDKYLDNLIELHIEEQKYVGKKFTYNNNATSFYDSHGYELKSIFFPEYKSGWNWCYVRGTDISVNNKKLKMTLLDFKKFFNAVKEYNEYMNNI